MFSVFSVSLPPLGRQHSRQNTTYEEDARGQGNTAGHCFSRAQVAENEWKRDKGLPGYGNDGHSSLKPSLAVSSS